MTTTNRLQPGQPFAQFEIIRLIGEGERGAVYEAVHPLLQKRFALKIPDPKIALSPEGRARFLREAEAASRINHPNVVDVSDVGTENDTPYLVMELLEGETLADRLAHRGRLDVAEALDLLVPVLSAVGAGHEQGVVHGGLKPQHIFLARGPGETAVPKVLDFGFAALGAAMGNGAVLNRTIAVSGVAAYLSPEQARGGRPIDGQTDQFLIGLMLYEAVTGARAYAGDTPTEVLRNIAFEAPFPVRTVRPDLPEGLASALMRMLALAPTDRFPSVLAAGRALLPFAGERTRMLLADAFPDPASDRAAGALAAGVPTPPEVRRPPAGPRRDRPVNVGGTQILPAPVMQLDSTFSRTPAKFGASVPDLRRSRRGLWVALGLMVPAAAVLLWASVGRHWLQDPEPNEPVIPFPRSAAEKPAEPERRVSPPAVRRFELRVEPSNAEIRLDDLPPVRGRLDRSIADDHAPHTIRISAAGHESQVIALDPDDLPPKVIRLNPLTSPPPARTANTDKKGTHRHKRAEGGSAVSRPIRERTSETQSRGTNDAPILP